MIFQRDSLSLEVYQVFIHGLFSEILPFERDGQVVRLSTYYISRGYLYLTLKNNSNLTSNLTYLLILIEGCYLPKSVGQCRASENSWYYNPEDRECESFVYGGCMGNDNRFKSHEACEQKCISPQSPGREIRLFKYNTGIVPITFFCALHVCTAMVVGRRVWGFSFHLPK